MRLFGLNRHRSRNLLLAISQLVLVAYVLQIVAIDHWQEHELSVTGIVGSSEHAALHADHCHGTPASCADAAAGFAHVGHPDAFAAPRETPTLALPVSLNGLGAPQTFAQPPTEPPRAA